MVDQTLINAWRMEADERCRETRRDLDADTRSLPTLAPGISVIVPSHQGRAHIGECLRSLAEQTLDHKLFEVIVVLNRPPDGTGDLIDQFRRSHPSVTLRLIRLSRASASRARNAGIAAASREYTTFIDDDDYVSRSFLEVLLAHAGPGVVPIAAVVDVGPRGYHAAADHADRMPAPLADKQSPAVGIDAATEFSGAKAVATGLIKDIPFDVDLGSGTDVVFWMNVIVRGRVEFVTCPPPDGATYYRAIRPDAALRRDLTFDSSVAPSIEVISRLEKLAAESDANALELVRSPIRAQTGVIGDYLQQHPADHWRVVEALDRVPIFHLPYGRMNTLARGLAIAFAFPPYADTSAVVTAKRIRAKGQVVDVIYNAMDSIRETDDRSRRIAGPFVGREASLATPSYFLGWGAMEQFSIEGLKVIHEWEATTGPYDWFYSRAHFAASHLLGAAYKLSNPIATWSAEFSDPLSRDILDQVRGKPAKVGAFLEDLRKGVKSLGFPVPDSPNCLVWCEEVTYALADELIFTNENQMEYMLGYCSNHEIAAIAREKAVIAPHPTLPHEFYSMVDHNYRLEEGVVHLAYFGNFYATRGLDDVLTAVAKSDSSTRARLQVHVFTTKPADLQRRAAELGVSEAVRVRPYVGYLEFLNLTTKFDCLIVNDAFTGNNHPRNPYLPSKWADYRGSGTPVWGLVEPDSPLSRQPLDFVSPVGDVEAALDVLSLLVRR